jgi:hypothetical protein
MASFDINTTPFPVLNDSINGEVTTAVCEIACESLQKIKVFCKENKSTISLFFTTVWSVVLHQYTDADVVYFAVNSANASMLGPLDEGQHRQPQDAIQTCQVLVNPETRVTDLLGNQGRRIRLLGHKQQLNHNTGVLLATKDTRHNPGTLLNDLNDSEDGKTVWLSFPLSTK